MVLLFAVQFLAAFARYGFEDTAFEALVWPAHKPLGVVFLVLLLGRAFWAMCHLSRRPPSYDIKAKLGHLALYMLMLVVPILALVRQYGSGRAFEPFGLSLMLGFSGDKIEWMVDLGSLLHGELGWALFVMACGHIAMVWIHRQKNADQDVLPRMWGT